MPTRLTPLLLLLSLPGCFILPGADCRYRGTCSDDVVDTNDTDADDTDADDTDVDDTDVDADHTDTDHTDVGDTDVGETDLGETDAVDGDLDGLSDDDEDAAGTDPTDPDSDDDGLSDGDEVHTWGTDPNDADTDGDLVPDDKEVLAGGSDPLLSDTDGDGLDDGQEDVDHDGVLDAGETDPDDVDTDGDGVDDDVEVLQDHTDPTDAADVDSDHDDTIDGDDCAPLDAARHPGAIETCDGVDEDCDGEADRTVTLLDPIAPGTGTTWSKQGTPTVSEITSTYDGTKALRVVGGAGCQPCFARKDFTFPAVALSRAYLELDFHCSVVNQAWGRLSVELRDDAGTALTSAPPPSVTEAGCQTTGPANSSLFTAGVVVTDRIALGSLATGTLGSLSVMPTVDAQASSSATVDIDEITLVVEACPP